MRRKRPIASPGESPSYVGNVAACRSDDGTVVYRVLKKVRGRVYKATFGTEQAALAFVDVLVAREAGVDIEVSGVTDRLVQILQTNAEGRSHQKRREYYARVARYVEEILGKAVSWQLTQRQVAEYVAERRKMNPHLTDHSIVAELKAIRTATKQVLGLERQVGLGWRIPENLDRTPPTKAARLPSDRDLIRAFLILSPEARDASIWCLLASLRPSDVLDVRWSDLRFELIDWERIEWQERTIRYRQAKTGWDYDGYISPMLRDILRDRAGQSRKDHVFNLTYNQLLWQWQKAASKCAFPRGSVGPGILRNVGITWLSAARFADSDLRRQKGEVPRDVVGWQYDYTSFVIGTAPCTSYLEARYRFLLGRETDASGREWSLQGVLTEHPALKVPGTPGVLGVTENVPTRADSCPDVPTENVN